MPRKAQSTPEQEEKKEAVNAPADEKQEQEKGTEAPTEGAVSPEVTPEQEEKKEDKPKKVYHFTSENPYLTVSAVGVYFSNGKASTDNLAVAKYLAGLEGVERCRILCGISEDNTKKLGLLSVLLEKAREDIEAFCRDTFIEPLTNNEGIITGYTDVFPKQLKNVQEDLAIQRFRKLGAEGESSYTLADESVTFDDPLPVSVEKKLYPYRQLFPRSYTLDDPVGGYKEG